MTFTAAANMTKAGFQMEIKKKQGLFNRFKKRFNVAKTTGEKQFLKAEACRIVNELKQCCKTWKNCGWGTCNSSRSPRNTLAGLDQLRIAVWTTAGSSPLVWSLSQPRTWSAGTRNWNRQAEDMPGLRECAG